MPLLLLRNYIPHSYLCILEILSRYSNFDRSVVVITKKVRARVFFLFLRGLLEVKLISPKLEIFAKRVDSAHCQDFWRIACLLVKQRTFKEVIVVIVDIYCAKKRKVISLPNWRIDSK